MSQMQAFIEKARSDSALMAKLDALGASGYGQEPNKIIALATEHGFAITEEDLRKAAETAGMQKSGELNEEELEAAAGGGTQNRYNPDVCGKYTRVEYECVGFLMLLCWCDHYRKKFVGSNADDGERHHHTCAMGCYDYVGDKFGAPLY